MKKYILTCLLFALFIAVATAQLTLKKMESSRKVSLPVDALIEIKLPTKSSRLDCNCFQSYKGYLKAVEADAVILVLTETNRETVEDNKAGIKEKSIFTQPKDSMQTRVPLSKVLAINRYSETNQNWQRMGGVVATLSVLNNLLLAPAIGGDFGTKMRNIGYGGMAFGLLTAFLPTKKIYYFEQQKKNKNKKSLWKLGN
jgi:hypothetical protein